jgi:hypothetical protein
VPAPGGVLVEHAVDLPYPPAEALRAVGEAADEWGAEFEPRGAGGQLHLPVVAGLRRGLLSGPVVVEAAGQGSRVVFRQAAQDYWLETSAIAVLAMAGAGALLTVAWPLFPRLLPGAPLGAVLALSGWFLVISRLRAKGPAEFLQTLAVRPSQPSAGEDPVGAAAASSPGDRQAHG